MYQFWLSVMDDDAVQLRIFHFLEEIEKESVKNSNQARHQRLAQKGFLGSQLLPWFTVKRPYRQAVHITEQLSSLVILNTQTLKLPITASQLMRSQQMKIEHR